MGHAGVYGQSMVSQPTPVFLMMNAAICSTNRRIMLGQCCSLSFRLGLVFLMVPAACRRRLPALNALKAFEAAARHESFTSAAQELCVTQGAVSHQVKALEQQLGLKLFNRERQRR